MRTVFHLDIRARRRNNYKEKFRVFSAKNKFFSCLTVEQSRSLFLHSKKTNCFVAGQQYAEYVEIDPNDSTMYAMHSTAGGYYHPPSATPDHTAPPPCSSPRLLYSQGPLILPPPPSMPPMSKTHSILIQRIPQRLRKARGSKCFMPKIMILQTELLS